MRRRDDLAVHNERVKLYVTISNAVGLAFFGLGVARPLADGTVPVTAWVICHLAVAGVMVGNAYISLGRLETEAQDLDRETRK
ncbi:hypothetical protein OCH239_12920 [Roseivivax halodurans JCM 10272]|uniref:Uncharacterized protein n=1 Tax=Roseivivax halodurans JCM 10272 TaxID=1449350 RepID=X7ED87_9RHOB|nr:hypothetical protein [Roseivivax halodurans]ETX13166.1 hypothetical protein OCH239_12920 [Roseivivax halodurans JCM 10272]